MSDEFERGSEFGDNSEAVSSFDFAGLTAENTEPLTGEFTAPSIAGSKPKWWERAPRKGKGSPKQDRVKNERKPRTVAAMPRGGLVKPLTNLYTGIGMSVMPFDPACGRIIIENASACAEALDELAKTNAAVRQVLLTLVTTSAWGAVIMAHAPIVMAVAMHHVPALKRQQEKMVGEFAEMMANGFQQPNSEGDDE